MGSPSFHGQACGPPELGHQSILSFITKISLGKLPRSLRDVMDGLSLTWQESRAFPESKSSSAKHPTIPASPCMLNHSFPVAEVRQEHHRKSQAHGHGLKSQFLAIEPVSSSAKGREDLPNRITIRSTGSGCSQGGVIRHTPQEAFGKFWRLFWLSQWMVAWCYYPQVGPSQGC